jgi:hypothetical protein
MFHYQELPANAVRDRAQKLQIRARRKRFRRNEIDLNNCRAAQRLFMFHYRA